MHEFSPDSINQAREIISAAKHDHTALLPCGNSSRLHRHLPGSPLSTKLSLSNLNQIIKIDAAEQTCIVEAGVSTEELSHALSEHKLELGVLAPNSQSGTIGGLFMAPDISLYRARWGNLREQVLNANWLLADGSEISTGAQVVKSVAGYDLTRLLLGSHGQLAACTRLCLRLRPSPRHRAWWKLAISQGQFLPNPHLLDLLFCVPGDEHYYIAADELAFDAHHELQQIDRQLGEQACVRALENFAAMPARFTSTSICALNPKLGAVDFLGRQQACQLAELPKNLPSCFPVTNSNPWMGQLQKAMCPDGAKFASMEFGGG